MTLQSVTGDCEDTEMTVCRRMTVHYYLVKLRLLKSQRVWLTPSSIVRESVVHSSHMLFIRTHELSPVIAHNKGRQQQVITIVCFVLLIFTRFRTIVTTVCVCVCVCVCRRRLHYLL